MTDTFNIFNSLEIMFFIEYFDIKQQNARGTCHILQISKFLNIKLKYKQ